MSNIAFSTLRVISRYGKNVSYVVTTEGIYDLETSSMTQETTSVSTVKAYRTKVSYSESQSPSLVGKDSALYLIAGKSIGFAPNVGDRIMDVSDQSDYQVLVVNKIEVGEEVALWRLICSRS